MRLLNDNSWIENINRCIRLNKSNQNDTGEVDKSKLMYLLYFLLVLTLLNV